ncbi:hypothetical protein [Chitinophaga sp. sic0106]|uniref:glycosyl-4,4'-diaponeurosporenoate acyltransferase CrtO family protein n=1 Tax=Chitinophaga sp. sic0106 TaxID=2854785 RepID=UPI001C48A943|nr:hypothetical protein [Chitinophaga sp. sic0106]MBV7530510.1 hypothetical protein [Chitinophaga sp. sic0106]
MRKKLTIILIVVATIVATAALMYYIKMDRFAFAWSLNFLLMLSTFLLTDAIGKVPLNSPYYDQKSWERGGKIYERLGVNIFRKFLVVIGWEKVIRKANPLGKNTASLEHLYYQTKVSELGHTIIFFVVLGFNIYVALKFGVVKSLSLLILNIILHVYPVFLQRYNRPRYARAVYLSKVRAQASAR